MGAEDHILERRTREGIKEHLPQFWGSSRLTVAAKRVRYNQMEFQERGLLCCKCNTVDEAYAFCCNQTWKRHIQALLGTDTFCGVGCVWLDRKCKSQREWTMEPRKESKFTWKIMYWDNKVIVVFSNVLSKK